VRLTGVRSRWVVAAAGGFLILLGLFPKLAAVVAAIPLPVLGGAGFALFGTVAATGIRTLSRVDFERNANVLFNILGSGDEDPEPAGAATARTSGDTRGPV
jgi:uric acid transporter